MIKVQYYGILKQLTGVAEEEMDVGRVSALIKEIQKRHGEKAARSVQQCFIMVNGKSTALMKGYHTILKPDEVKIIMPTGG